MSPDARKFYELDGSIQVFMGGKGNAKSVTAMVKLLQLSFAYPHTRTVFSRMIKEQLEMVNGFHFERLVPRGAYTKKHTESKSIKYTLKATGSEMFLMAAADPKKLEGIEIAAFDLDEASEMKTRQAFTVLDSRCRQKGRPNWSMLTFNPPSVEHWLYELIMLDENYKGKIQVVQGKTYANAHNLPPDYIEKLARYPKFLRQRFLEGIWAPDIENKPVYEEFEHSIHVNDRTVLYNSHYPVYRGLDTGFNHPCVLWVQIIGNRINVLMEYQGKKQVIEDVIHTIIPMELQRFGRRAEFINCCGHEVNMKSGQTGMTLAERLVSPEFEKKFGFVMPIRSKKTLVQEGTDVLKTKMIGEIGDRLFCVDPSCAKLTEALAGGYHVDENGKPVKDDTYDHLPDALRYIVVNGMSSGLVSESTTEKQIIQTFEQYQSELALLEQMSGEVGNMVLDANNLGSVFTID